MNTSVRSAELLLVRYGELSLKGGNRPYFERALVRNIKAACRDLSEVKVERIWGRMAVTPERRLERVARRLQDVFGIASISTVRGTEPTLEAITKLSAEVLAAALEKFPSDGQVRVRLRSRRADKRFPLNSTQISQTVAEAILPAHGERLKVNLKQADITLELDVRRERAFVFADRLPGLGGLPVGTLGLGLCLLSGGIDSPVAAWLSMKRGCAMDFVSFHSHPFIGEGSKRKIEQLVSRLARYQAKSRLYSVPFAEIQTAIRDNAPSSYRTVLYRRAMQRIASRIAGLVRAKALITGESLGQVASQTMENMTCIEDASSLPVFRPLLTFDKNETIDIAKRIGTFDISNIPEPDCCTVFMPPKPIIHGKVEICRDAEQGFDLDGLIDAALEGAERSQIAPAW